MGWNRSVSGRGQWCVGTRFPPLTEPIADVKLQDDDEHDMNDDDFTFDSATVGANGSGSAPNVTVFSESYSSKTDNGLSKAQMKAFMVCMLYSYQLVCAVPHPSTTSPQKSPNYGKNLRTTNSAPNTNRK